jgi:hypothetical protein
MAPQIYLVDPDVGNIHLAGKGVAWNGSGTPWTSQATSPFKLSLNDKTGGIYTPQAALPVEVWRGGPPFRIGSDLAQRGYSLVDEVLGVQAYGTTHDNVVALLRMLRRALSQGMSSAPGVFAFQPDGAGQPAYFEILSASLQESPSFISEEGRSAAQLAAGAIAVARATISWRRSPFGGRLSSGETITSGETLLNNGTGSPDNMVSFFVPGTGDRVREGGPLNVRIRPTTSTPALEVILATAHLRDYINRSDSLVTSSTVGTQLALSTNSLDSTAFNLGRGLRARLLLRLTNATINLEVRLRVLDANAVTTYYQSPWVRATTITTRNVLLDMGSLVPSFLYMQGQASTANLSFAVDARSTDGGATGGTLDYAEWLIYHTFCIASRTQDSDTLVIETFYERSGRPAIPRPTLAYSHDAGVHKQVEKVRGRPPVYIPGASLYVAWRWAGQNTHVTTEDALLTLTHAPLFTTFRGGV